MFIDHISTTELLPHNTDISISLREKDTSEESSRKLSMTQVEVPHWLRLPSLTLINLRLILNTSWPLKEPTSVNTSTVELELPSLSETSYRLTPSQKVLSSTTSRRELEIREPMPEPLELPSPSLDTLKMDPRPESDYHLDLERPLLETAEPPSDLLLEDRELISQS